jgi:hypothetical protein
VYIRCVRTIALWGSCFEENIGLLYFFVLSRMPKMPNFGRFWPRLLAAYAFRVWLVFQSASRELEVVGFAVSCCSVLIV